MTTRHGHGTGEVSDIHHPVHRPDAGHILHQITPQDRRSANERENSDRHRNANHPALPHLEICDSSRIIGLPFDRNHDGRVTRPELEQSVNDPAAMRAFPCAGAAAAALRNHFGEVAALTHSAPHAGDSAHPAPHAGDSTHPAPHAGDSAHPAPHASDSISLNNVVALQRLPANNVLARRINHEMAAVGNNDRNEGLFDRGGVVTPAAVQQGRLGDCTFLATLASLANTARGREYIAQMIHQNGDGFRVNFGNGQTIDTNRPTPAEMGMYARDSHHGIWANVMERAFGMARINDPLRNNIATRMMGLLNGRPMDPLRPQTEAEALPAHEVFSTVFGNSNATVTEHISLAGVSPEELHRRLAAVSPDALAMIANTPAHAHPNDPPTFADRVDTQGEREFVHDNHSYVFDHYDANTREVYLRNPWQGDQLLRMPLKSFQHSFENFDAVVPVEHPEMTRLLTDVTLM